MNSVLHLGTCMKVCPPSARSGPKSGGSGRARRRRHACGVRTLPRFGCRSEDTPTVRTTGEDTRSRPRPEKRKSRRWGARVVWGNGVVTVESLPVWIHLGFHKYIYIYYIYNLCVCVCTAWQETSTKRQTILFLPAALCGVARSDLLWQRDRGKKTSVRMLLL